MTGKRFDYISFLSDYGLSDEFVGVCHGVIKRIAPQVEVIDITHGIKPQSVREGAMVFAQAIKYMPLGVHLAIVDPGVGSERLPVIIETGDGSFLVGPDNGLLTAACASLDGAKTCRKITNPRLMLPNPSRTFQGRDIFAPAAAHLANGIDPADFGDEVAVESLIGLTVPEPRRHDDHFHATVLHIDRFGNLQLNLHPSQMIEMGLAPGEMMEVRLEGHRSLVTYGLAFASVGQGEFVVIEDSHGLIAVSVNHGSAADRLGAELGSSVIIGPPGSGAED
ncbi:MAG: S-adenosyl-l-methionine hydroxide adenosyltransferase family protein [Actinomycetota bacterium]|nr:SAM-dependent chlorinase/fluorinase [Actinomycetota bacterium]